MLRDGIEREINRTCNALALEVSQEIANDVAQRWRETLAAAEERIAALEAERDRVWTETARLLAAAQALLRHLPNAWAMADTETPWEEYMESRDWEACRTLVPALEQACAALTTTPAPAPDARREAERAVIAAAQQYVAEIKADNGVHDYRYLRPGTQALIAAVDALDARREETP